MDLYVSIGNSDDELTQQEWADYWEDVNNLIVTSYASDVYGVWTSETSARFQNACWAFNVEDEVLDDLGNDLSELRRRYRQDSIAVARAETIMLSDAGSGLNFDAEDLGPVE